MRRRDGHRRPLRCAPRLRRARPREEKRHEAKRNANESRRSVRDRHRVLNSESRQVDSQDGGCIPLEGYWPKSVTSIVSPVGFFASTCAFLPSMFTTTKFSVLATLIVMPSGGVSTSYSGAPPPPVMK